MAKKLKPATQRFNYPGPAWFVKMFAKAAHDDDWGVPCVYDYAAWKICKAVMRRRQRSTSDRASK